MLGACGEPDLELSHHGDEAAVALGLPAILAESRAVVRDALELEVSIGNRSVEMARVENTTRWTGSLNVAPGEYNVQVR